MVETKEELQKILNDFWLLDKSEYENIESMISQEIYEIDQILLNTKQEDNEEIESRDSLIILREKISYIISNGLYKK